MEEKDVTFNIERNDDYIQVMSDFEEDLDYLRIDEVIALITELVDYAIRKIAKETLEQHIDPTLEELNSSTLLTAVKITDEKVGDFIGNLIQIILHTTHNQDSIHESKQPKNNIGYSLSVYINTKENKKDREVLSTSHYGDIKNQEILLTIYTFYKDIVDRLAEQNISKPKIKEAINKSITLLLLKMQKYIEKHDKDTKIKE